MSKKGKNMIISEEKIDGNLFDEDNEEDTNELKKIQRLLSQSKENISESEDNNNDLNNKTNVSDSDNLLDNELKYDTNKNKKNAQEENDLSETYLTNKNPDEMEENSQLKSDDNIEINKLNKNINNNLYENEIEPNIYNKNINIQNQILNKNILDEVELLLSKSIENMEEKQSKEKKGKKPIFFIRKIKKRSKKIQLLRKKKGIHLMRKKDSDIIRKKIKTYFHNYLIDKLNLELKDINIKKNISGGGNNSPIKKLIMKKINKFLKLNNKFTTNVSINLNRNLLLKKISQILIDEPISSKYKTFNSKNNIYLTKYILASKSFPRLYNILNSTYEESFKEFIKSNNFHYILEKIKKRDGLFYLNQFKTVSNNFINFYNKGRFKKSPKKEKKTRKFISNKISEKEESKRSKESKKSKKSISFCFYNKTPRNSDENKLRNFSLSYMQSINSHSKNNIISLIEEYQSFKIFSKEESELIHNEKNSLFKDSCDMPSFLNEKELIDYNSKDYKIMEEMDNLSLIQKQENEKGQNIYFNEHEYISIKEKIIDTNNFNSKTNESDNDEHNLFQKDKKFI